MKTPELAPDEERLVRVFRALGNPMRFRILQTLHERQACVCGEIVDLLPLAQSSVSEHLRVLREAGLVQASSKDRPPAIAPTPTPCAGCKWRPFGVSRPPAIRRRGMLSAVWRGEVLWRTPR
jgi:ArsR family transcriptional regulator